MLNMFASDNSKKTIFTRLKFTNHRGFFSFIFVTLSVIFIIITYAAVQQQQTTKTKAATSGICVPKSSVIPEGSRCKSDSGATLGTCVSGTTCTALNDGTNAAVCRKPASTCKNLGERCGSTAPCCGTNKCLSNGVGSEKTCQSSCSCTKVDEGCSTSTTPCTGFKCQPFGPGAMYGTCKSVTPTPSSCSCTAVGQGCNVTGSIPCEGFVCSPSGGSNPLIGTCQKKSTNCTRYDGQSCGTGGQCQTSTYCTPISLGAPCVVSGKNGKYTSGCPGDSATKCCVPNTTPTPTPTPVIGGCINRTFTGSFTPATASAGMVVRINCNYGVFSSTFGAGINTASTCVWKGWDGYKAQYDCAAPNTKGSYKVVCTSGTGANTCAQTNNLGNLTVVTTITPTPTPTITPTPTPGESADVKLNLKLFFQGIKELPKTTKQLKIKVKLVDAVNKTKENDSSVFTADNSGIWSGTVEFKDVDLSQKYYLLLKGPMHIQKKICAENATDPTDKSGYYSCQFGNITLKSGVNNFDYSKVKMLVGDLKNPTQNGVIDSHDLAIVRNAVSLKQKQKADVLEKADLNLDGGVSTQDWDLMIEAMEIKYDDK